MTSAQLTAEIEKIAPAARETHPDESRRGTVSAAMPRILVVDDEWLIQALLADYLQEHGFDCETAASGEEALRKLENGDFVLLLTDISMPGISGLDLLRYAAENCPEMSVIVTTAVLEPATAAESRKLGAVDYICKPFDLEVALTKVNEALNRRREQPIPARVHENEIIDSQAVPGELSGPLSIPRAVT